MANIISLLASNSAYAITLIKQYVLKPVLVCPVPPNGSVTDPVPITTPVPLSCHHYRCYGESAVSRRVVINLNQGKQNATDNVAPGPHEWEIEAHVGGLPFEITSRFMPSIGMMLAALDNAYMSRQQVGFFDKFQKLWQIVVQRFEYEPTPDEENAILVRLHLVELNVQVVGANGVVVNPVTAAASPADGTAYGTPEDLGTTENAIQAPSSASGVSLAAIPGVSFG
jgi:hypothetical protein